MRRIRFSVEGFPEPPAYDTAVSHAILSRVASGDDPETVRLFRPGRVVAFGRQDTVHPGYAEALVAVRNRGFSAVERLAGGRAAVFHENTIAFSWAIPSQDPTSGVIERFSLIATIVREALASMGLDARIGEVPGEYCPGGYSVNLAGTRKVMGVGQRLVRGGAHVGGVIVVAGADLVNDVLTPVYEALAFDWDPDATGAIGTMDDWALTTSAIRDAFGRRFELEHGSPCQQVLSAATELVERHTPPGQPSGGAV